VQSCKAMFKYHLRDLGSIPRTFAKRPSLSRFHRWLSSKNFLHANCGACMPKICFCCLILRPRLISFASSLNRDLGGRLERSSLLSGADPTSLIDWHAVETFGNVSTEDLPASGDPDSVSDLHADVHGCNDAASVSSTRCVKG
jgi:hypothetical protein